MMDVVLNNVPVKMELHTDAAVSIIGESTYNNIRQQSFVSPLQLADSKLRTYTGHHIEVLSITKMRARYGKIHVVAPV